MNTRAFLASSDVIFQHSEPYNGTDLRFDIGVEKSYLCS